MLQVFEGVVIDKGGSRAVKRELNSQEKKRRIVLKRVFLDPQGIRTNFLKSGTMARVRASSYVQGGLSSWCPCPVPLESSVPCMAAASFPSAASTGGCAWCPL